MQVFGSSPRHATTLMLRIYNGSLVYYRDPVLVPYIYNRWFKLNVIHDVDNSNIEVYIDGVLVYVASGRGGTSHYFKCGVYAQNDCSYYMESRWKRIKVFKKLWLMMHGADVFISIALCLVGHFLEIDGRNVLKILYSNRWYWKKKKKKRDGNELWIIVNWIKVMKF